MIQPTDVPTVVLSEMVCTAGEVGKNGCTSFTSSTTMVTSVRVAIGNVAESRACMQKRWREESSNGEAYINMHNI